MYYYSTQKHGLAVAYFFTKVFHCLCHFPDLIGIIIIIRALFPSKQSVHVTYTYIIIIIYTHT